MSKQNVCVEIQKGRAFLMQQAIQDRSLLSPFVRTQECVQHHNGESTRNAFLLSTEETNSEFHGTCSSTITLLSWFLSRRQRWTGGGRQKSAKPLKE